MAEMGCEACGGQGITDYGELHELDPLWYDEKDVSYCLQCGGDPVDYVCMSSREWCESHPLVGRETTPHGTIEWFTFDPKPCQAPTT